MYNRDLKLTWTQRYICHNPLSHKLSYCVFKFICVSVCVCVYSFTLMISQKPRYYIWCVMSREDSIQLLAILSIFLCSNTIVLWCCQVSSLYPENIAVSLKVVHVIIYMVITVRMSKVTGSSTLCITSLILSCQLSL